MRGFVGHRDDGNPVPTVEGVFIIQSDLSKDGGGDADVGQSHFTRIAFGQAGLGKGQGQRAVGPDHATGGVACGGFDTGWNIQGKHRCFTFVCPVDQVGGDAIRGTAQAVSYQGIQDDFRAPCTVCWVGSITTPPASLNTFN